MSVHEHEDGTACGDICRKTGLPTDDQHDRCYLRGVTVRQACRERRGLDGTDAQALEHALTITERERDEARATNARLNRRCQEYESALAEKIDSRKGGRLFGMLAYAGLRMAEDDAASLRAHLETLRTDVEAARSYRENKGGQQVTCAPRLVGLPPSIMTYLERLCRDALGEEPSE